MVEIGTEPSGVLALDIWKMQWKFETWEVAQTKLFLYFFIFLLHYTIFFRNLLWLILRKKCSSCHEKTCTNSSMKAHNLQIYLDNLDNLFDQWKDRTLFETQYLFNLLLEVFQILNQLKCQLKQVRK